MKMKTALHLCDRCGLPVGVAECDSRQFPEWERRLGNLLVVHCIDCAGEE